VRRARNRSAATKPNGGGRPVNRWGAKRRASENACTFSQIQPSKAGFRRHRERRKLLNCASWEECSANAAGGQSTGGRRGYRQKILALQIIIEPSTFRLTGGENTERTRELDTFSFRTRGTLAVRGKHGDPLKRKEVITSIEPLNSASARTPRCRGSRRRGTLLWHSSECTI
jgi:hypothetical protein